MENKDKIKIQIHMDKEQIKILDEYIRVQNITTRKKFIQFLVEKFIKNIK